MPNINEMIPSKYLKKEDVGIGKLATIRAVVKDNIAQDGKEPEYKWSAVFEEDLKPMLLNSTNLHAISAISKSEESENWPGTQIVLFNDPNVTFGAERTGGIRIRAPKSKQEQELPF